MILGFLQDSDLQPLRDEITDLKLEVSILKSNQNKLQEEISLLKNRVQSLSEFCYNVGGDVALLRRERESDDVGGSVEGFDITVH